VKGALLPLLFMWGVWNPLEIQAKQAKTQALALISPIRSSQLNFGALKAINSQFSDRILNGFPTVTLILGTYSCKGKVRNIIIFEF